MKLAEKIYTYGRSFFSYPFKVYYIDQAENDVNTDSEADGDLLIHNLIISVPKKIFKRAVSRNKIRRRIREAYRLNKDSFQNLYSKRVLIVYVANEILEYKKIETSLKYVLEKIS